MSKALPEITRVGQFFEYDYKGHTWRAKVTKIEGESYRLKLVRETAFTGDRIVEFIWAGKNSLAKTTRDQIKAKKHLLAFISGLGLIFYFHPELKPIIEVAKQFIEAL